MDLFSSQVDETNWPGIANIVNLIGEEFDAKSMWQVDELSFNIYRKEIRRNKWIDYEEEQSLIKRIQNGDNDAFEQLVLSNLGFVINIAKRYQNHGLSLNDLISEGNIGLMNAAKKCEAERFGFRSFAIYHIRSSIMQAIKKYGTPIHYSNEVLTNVYPLQKYICKFQLKNGRSPSYEEIEENLGLTVNKIHDALAVWNGISLDYIFECLPDTDLSDVFINLAIYDFPENDYSYPADSELVVDSLRIDIKEMLDLLSGLERDVLTMFFGLNCKEMDLNEIAEKMNLGRERVRQIRERAIKKLRKNEHDLLRRYLG